MPIDRKELEAKIKEYIQTKDDNLDTQEVLNKFFFWIYEADIKKEARRQQYLALKAEFEPEAPVDIKPTIEWRQTPAGAHVASLNGKDVANVWQDSVREGWIGQRWSQGFSAATSKVFDTVEEAKTWAVGHL